MIYREFKCRELWMYEPYNKYYSKETDNIHFINNTFVLQPNKFDVIFFITSLHHIMNPEHMVNIVRLSLKKNGYVIVREH